MATKSILKNVNLKSKRSVRALANALENASGKYSRPVQRQRAVSDASREDIRKMFGGQDDRL